MKISVINLNGSWFTWIYRHTVLFSWTVNDHIAWIHSIYYILLLLPINTTIYILIVNDACSCSFTSIKLFREWGSNTACKYIICWNKRVLKGTACWLLVSNNNIIKMSKWTNQVWIVVLNFILSIPLLNQNANIWRRQLDRRFSPKLSNYITNIFIKCL